jgi:hypothetical protein
MSLLQLLLQLKLKNDTQLVVLSETAVGVGMDLPAGTGCFVTSIMFCLISQGRISW